MLAMYRFVRRFIQPSAPEALPFNGTARFRIRAGLNSLRKKSLGRWFRIRLHPPQQVEIHFADGFVSGHDFSRGEKPINL
jgi:hypothetical protein